MAGISKELAEQLDSVNQADFIGDVRSRENLMDAARRLIARLEPPFERAFRLTHISNTVMTLSRIVYDIGLWEAWYEAGGRECSLEQLVDLCKTRCDKMLLSRILRMLCAEHVVEEVGEDLYQATALSLELGRKSSPTTQAFVADRIHSLEALENLPKFLARTNYQEPLDPTDTNYMELTPEKYTFFERIAADPALQANFDAFQIGNNQSKVGWTDIYDTTELMNGYKNRSAFLADLGGGHGLDIIQLLKSHHDLPSGALILQDLPHVLEVVSVDERITKLAHDFFKPQPVHGARAYFLHCVLHDWDDLDCRRILKNIADAMTKGYSKLLVCEHLVPTSGATTVQSGIDIGMMIFLSTAERNEAKWRTLLIGSGFKVVKIWSHPSSVESVIEAELA